MATQARIIYSDNEKIYSMLFTHDGYPGYMSDKVLRFLPSKEKVKEYFESSDHSTQTLSAVTEVTPSNVLSLFEKKSVFLDFYYFFYQDSWYCIKNNNERTLVC